MTTRTLVLNHADVAEQIAAKTGMTFEDALYASARAAAAPQTASPVVAGIREAMSRDGEASRSAAEGAMLTIVNSLNVVAKALDILDNVCTEADGADALKRAALSQAKNPVRSPRMAAALRALAKHVEAR